MKIKQNLSLQLMFFGALFFPNIVFAQAYGAGKFGESTYQNGATISIFDFPNLLPKSGIGFYLVAIIIITAVGAFFIVKRRKS